MERKVVTHTPLDTGTGSIVSPEAEAAKRHLGWHPDPDEPGDPVERVTADQQMFTTYTGYPDKSFEVQVIITRGAEEATQAARGLDCTKSGAILDALREAYEGADRALVALMGRRGTSDTETF